MKIISLNVFSGCFYLELSRFLRLHAETTDIFLFQEVYNAPQGTPDVEKYHTKLFSELRELLPDFIGMHSDKKTERIMGPDGFEIDAPYGNATFLRKNVVHHGTEFLDLPSAPVRFARGSALVTKVTIDEKDLVVCNVHGAPEPGDKRDTPERIAASQKIIETVSGAGETIVAGDFNLLPDTESIELFVRNGYRNLVVDYKISTTRGSLPKILHPEYGIPPSEFQEFADYLFVTPDIKVKSFEVPDVAVSDHLPLIMEFDF